MEKPENEVALPSVMSEPPILITLEAPMPSIDRVTLALARSVPAEFDTHGATAVVNPVVSWSVPSFTVVLPDIRSFPERFRFHCRVLPVNPCLFMCQDIRDCPSG